MANKNILEVAFSKIQENKKTELSEYKIDLAPQFVDFNKKAQSIYLDARNLAQKDLMDLRDKFEKGEKRLISLENELESQISKIEKTAKEIGVDIYSTKVGKSIKGAKDEIKHYRSSFGKAINNVKSVKI